MAVLKRYDVTAFYARDGRGGGNARPGSQGAHAHLLHARLAKALYTADHQSRELALTV